jgi:protein-arginine kinase activator protein McsA
MRTIELGARIKQLQKDLEKAVSDENYETAAQLRDQLRELEHNL